LRRARVGAGRVPAARASAGRSAPRRPRGWRRADADSSGAATIARRRLCPARPHATVLRRADDPAGGEEAGPNSPRGFMTRANLILAALLALAVPLSLLAGRVWLDPATTPNAALILAEMRLPRAVLAVVIGVGLGAAGAAMQGY